MTVVGQLSIPKNFDSEKREALVERMRNKILDAASGRDTSDENYTPLLKDIKEEALQVDASTDSVKVWLNGGLADDQTVLYFLSGIADKLISELK